MMYGHQCSQGILAFATKALQKPTTQETKKIFCFSKKEQSQKQKKITTTFGKSLVLIKYRMRYAIYMPPNTKALAINETMVANGNRQNATAFARAHDSDLLRSLKHLMETRPTAITVPQSAALNSFATM